MSFETEKTSEKPLYEDPMKGVDMDELVDLLKEGDPDGELDGYADDLEKMKEDVRVVGELYTCREVGGLDPDTAMKCDILLKALHNYLNVKDIEDNLIMSLKVTYDSAEGRQFSFRGLTQAEVDEKLRQNIPTKRKEYFLVQAHALRERIRMAKELLEEIGKKYPKNRLQS